MYSLRASYGEKFGILPHLVLKEPLDDVLLYICYGIDKENFSQYLIDKKKMGM